MEMELDALFPIDMKNNIVFFTSPINQRLNQLHDRAKRLANELLSVSQYRNSMSGSELRLVGSLWAALSRLDFYGASQYLALYRRPENEQLLKNILARIEEVYNDIVSPSHVLN